MNKQKKSLFRLFTVWKKKTQTLPCYHKISCNAYLPEFPHKANIHNLMICSITLFGIILYIENVTSAAQNCNYSEVDNLQTVPKVLIEYAGKITLDLSKYHNIPWTISYPITHHRGILVTTHQLCSWNDRILIPKTNGTRHYSQHKLSSCGANFSQFTAHSMRSEWAYKNNAFPPRNGVQNNQSCKLSGHKSKIPRPKEARARHHSVLILQSN